MFASKFYSDIIVLIGLRLVVAMHVQGLVRRIVVQDKCRHQTASRRGSLLFNTKQANKSALAARGRTSPDFRVHSNLREDK